MTIKPTLQERAFQLTADCRAISEIRQILVREGYDSVDMHLMPPRFRLSLKRMLRAAAKAKMIE